MGRFLGPSYPKTYDPRRLDLDWRVLGESGKSWGRRRKAREEGNVGRSGAEG